VPDSPKRSGTIVRISSVATRKIAPSSASMFARLMAAARGINQAIEYQLERCSGS
jgi:hypothetical protein